MKVAFTRALRCAIGKLDALLVSEVQKEFIMSLFGCSKRVRKRSEPLVPMVVAQNRPDVVILGFRV